MTYGFDEYWNEKRDEYYKTLGREDSYRNRTSGYEDRMDKWLEEKVLKRLRHWENSNFRKYGFDPECPRIILFHEYNVPQRKNIHYSLRERTNGRYEVHIYWFKNKDLYKNIDSLNFIY